MLYSVSCDGIHQIFEFIYLFIYLFIYFDIDSYVSFTYFVMLMLLLLYITSANINFILILNGTNFKDWKENVLIVLSCMDLDLALQTDQLPSLTTDSSTESKKEFER